MTLQHGYDGNAPIHEPARDIDAFDRKTGKRIREPLACLENLNHTRVSMMLAGKRLEPRQAEAAGIYYRDWHDGELLVVASAALLRVNGGGQAQSTPSDRKIDAQRRRKNAERAIWQRFHAIIWKVVIEGKIMETAASELRIHHQRAAERLEIGLDMLADHYGLA